MATWTPDALSRETVPLGGRCWRVVEGQHVISTLKLVDTVAEQHLLEAVLERTKPPVPAECRHLHYLLSTPFRYGAPYPYGSRFRRAGLTPGVFYGSTTPSTAMAELVFWRLLFYAESPGTPWPANPGEYTAFSARYRTGAGLDLTRPPLARGEAAWTHPTDYGATQALADSARAAGVQGLKYRSARSAGRNVALLSCRAFASTAPLERQTWRLHLGSTGARAYCESPHHRLEFTRETFAADPRIARMRWGQTQV